MMNSKEITLLNTEAIKTKICFIRGQQVMLDSDLAKIYGVETKSFNQAVKRNSERFPKTFCFQLTDAEFNYLRSQFVTLKNMRRGQHRKYLPYAFTEQGVSMLSAVLHSKIAIQVSIKIIDAFVEMRRFINNNAQIFSRLDLVERKQLVLDLKKHNEQYPAVIIKVFEDSHDRFLIIDEKEIYHIGASLKDLGKKWFAFSKIELEALEMLRKLGEK